MLRRIDEVACELEFPMGTDRVHSIFNIFMLRRCVGRPSTIEHFEVVGVVGLS